MGILGCPTKKDMGEREEEKKERIDPNPGKPRKKVRYSQTRKPTSKQPKKTPRNTYYNC